jgi:tetratricopeptide (TPR) repeat protein
MNVALVTICNGSQRTVAHATPADDFAFQWNMPSLTPQPATSGVPELHVLGSTDGDAAAHGGAQGLGGYCDLRADVAGYKSSVINLMNPGAFDSDLGVIWLHRVRTTPDDDVVSIWTLRAPKDAMKDFTRGEDLLRTGKLDQAAESFYNAVTIDPQFAEAWFFLGKTQFGLQSDKAAQDSLERATDLDDKMVGAWEVLGYIAVNRQDWTEAAGYLDRAVHMAPQSSAFAWYMDAIADYQLGRFDEAEQRLRTEIKLDPQMRNRRAPFLLSLILVSREELPQAVQTLRSYLAGSPDPGDVPQARSMLARLDPEARK